MKQFTEVVKTIEEAKKTMEILPTGFKIIDDYLEGGFLKKELVVLGGATGRGKSLFGGTIFYNIAREGFKSAYFSLEISSEMLVSRLMGAKSNLSPTKIMIKMLDEREEGLRDDAKAEISAYEEFMFFYDSIYEMDLIEKEIRDNQYDFVVIDFIQNVMSKQKDEYERLSYIALHLQKLAKETNCCILALSQLSNQMSKDKRDDVVEYKGSGSIGTVCDLGFFIEKSGLDDLAMLKLRKNRRGVSGASFNFMVKQPGGLLVDHS